MNNKLVATLVLLLAVVFFAFGSYFYKGSQQKQQSQTVADNIERGEAQLVRQHSPSLGSPLYKVTLVEFLDPECESCRVFHPIVKDLLEKYKDRIHYVVRYAPFHRHSKDAVAFLEAARMQGKYWETLDLLFERQPQWADHHNPKPEMKWDYIAELGLDEGKMREDIKSPDIQKIIELDIEDGKNLYIRGTPTFFINGKSLQQFGAEPLARAIADALES